MFKGRIGLWIILFVVCLLAQLGIKWIPTWFTSYETTIMIDVEDDVNLSEFLIGQKINGFKLLLNTENPSMIISSEKIQNEDYVEYKDYLSSPIVLYVPAQLHNSKNNGFSSFSDGGKVYQVDLLSILEAVESGANFETLGFHKDVVSGIATLYIPSEQSPYYDEVIDLFYLTLNKGKIPTVEEKTQLKSRMETILNKCIKVADIRQAIKDEANKPSENKKLFIAPEYLHKTCEGMYTYNGSYKDYVPVYFTKTNYLKASIYILNTENGEVSTAKWFLEKIQKKYDFMSKTGWRVANRTYDLYNVSSYYMENP